MRAGHFGCECGRAGPPASLSSGVSPHLMSALLDTLKALPTDPSRVIDLYSQLYAASFITLVQAGTEARLSTALFLTYPAQDNIRELPLFTCREFVLQS